MPVQFQGVAVNALPGSRQSRPDGLHALLEPAAPPLEDPEPYVGPRLPEKREVNSEPVVVPRRGTALAEQVLQPFLAFGGQPVHLQRPPAGTRPASRGGPGRLGLVVLLRDQPGREQFVQARVERPVGERAEQPEDAGDLLAQLIAVHRRPVQHPEHGELEDCGPVAPHAAPSVLSGWPFYPYLVYPHDASRRYFGSLDRLDVSNRYICIVGPASAPGKPEPDHLPDSAQTPVGTYSGEHDVKAFRRGLRAGPPGHPGVRVLRAHDRHRRLRRAPVPAARGEVPRRAHRRALPELPEDQADPRHLRLRRRARPVRGTGEEDPRTGRDGRRIR